MNRTFLLIVALGLAAGMAGALRAAQPDAALPPGVRVVWDAAKAYRETTPMRERVCLNGLWRWQPAEASAESVPADRWGFFKVPGCWPGITDYLQKDCQTVYPHPAWKEASLRDRPLARALAAAWYQREITIPADWAARRILVQAEYINSLATVYLDGKRAGEIRFPGGEIDLTALCRP